MKTYKEYKKNILKDPEVKAVYDSLEPAYKMAKSFIKARLDKKLTQDELAIKAGVTLNTIIRLESGATNLTLSIIRRVAAALDKELKLVSK